MKDPKATVRLPENKLKAFKLKTIKNGTTIQEVLASCIDAYLHRKDVLKAVSELTR